MSTEVMISRIPRKINTLYTYYIITYTYNNMARAVFADVVIRKLTTIGIKKER